MIRCNVEGIRFEKGLGPYPKVSLKESRRIAQSIQFQLFEGKNPFKERGEVKRKRREAARAAIDVQKSPPFAEAVYRCHALNRGAWTKQHARIWLSMFRNHAFPKLADTPVGDITTSDVVEVLTPLVLEKPETGRRLRQRMEVVFDWAIAADYYHRANPAAYGGKLKHLLPKVKRRVTHRKALDWNSLPSFWADFSAQSCMSALALRFLILTCTRSGETRGATWNEVDASSAMWEIPAERMKAREGHGVPLSHQALDVLSHCPGINDTVIFPSDRVRRDGSHYLGENAVTSLLKKGMGRHDFTPHGFRSSFRDWASECANIRREVSEKVLAHKVGDAVERAYARSDLLEVRRDAMQEWANFVTSNEC